MKWVDYEIALTERLRYEFQPPWFRVVHNTKIEGVYSKGQRQIDVAVYRLDEPYPFLVAEAKRHTKTLDIGYVDAFIVKLKEVKAKIGLLTVASGFSEPSKRLAKAFGIELEVMSAEEALKMQWLPVARSIFPFDWAYHPELADGLYRIQDGSEPQSIIDALENIPYEEWLSFVEYALEKHPIEARRFLLSVALIHRDDGCRFNAVQTLIDNGGISRSDVELLTASESDESIIELLNESIP